MKRKVLAGKCMPPSLPFGLTAITWLFFDRYDISGAWAGAGWSFVFIIWAICIVNLFLVSPAEPKWND